jgi:hypothetical protein
MSTTLTAQPYRVRFFDTVQQADQAIRGLLDAGFTKNELAVICPKQFQDSLPAYVPRAEPPGSHAAAAIVEGGAAGAVLGGIALAATAIATGGVGLIPAAGVLIGGGALAGGFSGLILREGYGEEIGQHYLEAVRLGKIAVGVEIEGKRNAVKLEEADRIMAAAGGHTLDAVSENTVY